MGSVDTWEGFDKNEPFCYGIFHNSGGVGGVCSSYIELSGKYKVLWKIDTFKTVRIWIFYCVIPQ